MHNLAGRQLPHQILRELARKYGPLMHIQLGQVSAVVVSSAKMAKEILVTHDPAFATRPESLATKTIWYKRDDLAFGFYGDFVKQMRKICVTELLSGKNVRSFTFIRQDENSKLISTIRSAQGRPVNVTKMILAYSSSMACKAAFVRVCKNKETMLKQLTTSVAIAGGFNLADFFPSLEILPISTGLKRKWKKMHHEWMILISD
ncbi:premnaspirodiene oxygenase-like [Coffea eugenioides]|uniref:premnaspirodiene oxygenase-like n=1 Tax=Coffea eugenioides TaxID=49369 RepID=UPI000F607F11|nr:premnaspirodiene oxygenase-like [Coffea eugenioides]